MRLMYSPAAHETRVHCKESHTSSVILPQKPIIEMYRTRKTSKYEVESFIESFQSVTLPPGFREFPRVYFKSGRARAGQNHASRRSYLRCFVSRRCVAQPLQFSSEFFSFRKAKLLSGVLSRPHETRHACTGPNTSKDGGIRRDGFLLFHSPPASDAFHSFSLGSLEC